VNVARLTRRQFLRTAAASLVAGPALLAACDHSAQPTRFYDWDRWWRRREQKGVVDFANWPYYIDRRRDNSHPSLQAFSEGTGIRVNYYRPIQDNQQFLDRISGDLEAGNPTGYDIIVITNGPQLSELIERGWLIPLDHHRLPNFAQYASGLAKNPSWDPNNRYSVAWQSGLTGVAYRPEAVEALGRQPTSLADLFHPALKGRVGMMRDLMDLGSAGLLLGGVDPATSTPPDWQAAAARLTRQRDDGLVSAYYGQPYLGALQRGEIWITQAWSGDIYQANQLGHPELRFVIPTEGALLWTDNMLIPKGAVHPVDALELMNFVYDPAIAALIADWVWYICPVPRAQGIVANKLGDPTVAHSDLVFPTTRVLGPSLTTADGDVIYPESPFSSYPTLATNAERSEWHRTFAPILPPIG
jgi:spermidine/putrescine transport system substrate-binding protein